MSKKWHQNNITRSVLGLLAFILVLVAVAQLTAKDQVSGFLDRKLPSHVQLQYKNINVNVLTGAIGLDDISIDFYDRDSMLLNTEVVMDAIALEGLGYWDFLVHQKIDVGRLTLKNPEVRHYLYNVLPKEDAEPEGVVQLLKVIEIGELSVKNGRLHLLQDARDSVALEVHHVDFEVARVRTGPEQIAQKIPVEYGRYELKADSILVDLGPYETLQVSSLLWNKTRARITDVKLRSKYDKSQLSQHLRTERDHVQLDIPQMDLDSIRFGFEKDTFFIVTGGGVIQHPDLEVYRDKKVADDTESKRLYSRVLRQLPIHLNVPLIDIVDGKVVYSERVSDVEHPGKLSFEKLNATLSQISNTYPRGEKTSIKASTQFMGYADMTLDWSFDVNDTNDAFLAKGTVFHFETKSVNPFLESNLRTRVSGTIDELYFTVSGNAFSSAGDMKMKYNDLEFSVLKKNRLGINKLLTAVGNLFVDDGSDTDAEGYRYGKIEVERDATKSFFNYLWLNVRDGTLNTLTGDGEKEE